MSRVRTEDPKQLTVQKVSNLFEIPERTLQYWIETGLIQPALYTGQRGKTIILSHWNLLETAVILELRARGASLQAVRKAVDYIKDRMDSKIYERRLFVTEKDIRDSGSLSKMNGRDKARIISLVEQQGQMFFINLKQIKQRVERELANTGFSLN